MGTGLREVSHNRVPSLVLTSWPEYIIKANPIACQHARLQFTLCCILQTVSRPLDLSGLIRAFPMERFCGTLQRAIQSRRYPYASVSHFISETAQLHQIANLYDIAGILALRSPRSLAGALSHPSCMYIIFKT